MKLESTDNLEYIESQLKLYSGLDQRLLEEEESSRSRNNFQRDYSRIVYSASFRRLQGKMQLLPITSNNFHRNRLTHSYEVAQIARSIAEVINSKLDDLSIHIPLYVVESAALAHDIGNPPFGHYGEKVLHKLSKEIGGFEGNAQTLRILMNLEQKLPNKKGLNLTLRTLLAATKYYNIFNINDKKFIYDIEYNKLNDQLKNLGPEFTTLPRTIEAQIMDLSDEIAYAAHDLEDALSQNYFNIDDLIFEFYNSDKYKDVADNFYEIVKESRRTARECDSLTSDTYNFYFKKELVSNVVNELIRDIDVCKMTQEHRKKTGSSHINELGFSSLGLLSDGLKSLTFNCVKRSDSVQLYEKRGEVIITKLFDVFMNQDFNKNFDLLPPQYRPNITEGCDECKETLLWRCSIDYISGMMDTYAVDVYEKYFGKEINIYPRVTSEFLKKKNDKRAEQKEKDESEAKKQLLKSDDPK